MLRRNILIFHAGALGDFVLTWPLGLALGRLFPQSRIIYVTQRQKGVLAEKVLSLESADSEAGWHHLFGNAGQLPQKCRERILSAHSIFTFLAEPGDHWVEAVRELDSHADVVTLQMRNPPEGHATDRLLSGLNIRPAIQAAVRQILASIADRGVGRARAIEAGSVVIHPGSGSREKCWPMESFLELARKFQAAGRTCKFIVGEVELDRWPSADLRRLESVAPVFHPATYVDLYAEIASAETFVGNDSGPAHLAGILGVQTIALFGPSDPTVWHPLGPHVNVLHRPILNEISVGEVFSVASSGLVEALPAR